MKLKKEEYDNLVRPVCAFITFEEEEGYQTATRLKMKNSETGKPVPSKYKLLNEDLYLEQATEPTNIIWENRHYSSLDMLMRGVVVLSAISFLLFVSFTIIFICKRYSMSFKTKYPDVDCGSIQSLYGKGFLNVAY